MKAIMVMFDSLNRRVLPPYGCDWIHAPNFSRLAEHAVTFDNCYVGSMPCMPARRELHTGRYNFLHRSWGPIEPFDDSMPEILKRNGIHTHLVSDHYHYWEDGGATYHNRYSTWEISRGQMGDPWKGDLRHFDIPEHIGGRATPRRVDWLNRFYIHSEEEMPQAKTFAMGLEFLRTNAHEDNWFLQLETFDPHEPFFTLQQYKDLYPHDYKGPIFDYPKYDNVKETKEQVEHCRYEYAALVSMCDTYLGRVLDLMDELDLWRDTMLILNTDHGFLLGEHNWWGKCVQPSYNEVARIPLFIWDPRCGCRNEHRSALVQTIDLPATILEYFGITRPYDMQGVPLHDTILTDTPVREAGLFGLHGGHVNVTDGWYVYMRGAINAANEPLYNYTLMPTHMRAPFTVEELQTVALARPFAFTKNCHTLRIQARAWDRRLQPFETLLFDLVNDPQQENTLHNRDIEQRMIAHLVRLMQENDAPAEQFERLGLR